MAYDEGLAQRIREQLTAQTDFSEKKMFGGLAFMVRGHMAVGVVKDELMARVGAEQYEVCLQWSGAKPMDFTGRPMKGMVFVAQPALAEDDQLQRWLQQSLAFVANLPSK